MLYTHNTQVIHCYYFIIPRYSQSKIQRFQNLVSFRSTKFLHMEVKLTWNNIAKSLIWNHFQFYVISRFFFVYLWFNCSFLNIFFRYKNIRNMFLKRHVFFSEKNVNKFQMMMSMTVQKRKNEEDNLSGNRKENPKWDHLQF